MIAKKTEDILMWVYAVDEKGNEYPKVVSIVPGNIKQYSKLISFGWPCEYDLSNFEWEYVMEHGLCIDIGGLNHKGVPNVCIHYTDMRRIYDETSQYFRELKNK